MVTNYLSDNGLLSLLPSFFPLFAHVVPILVIHAEVEDIVDDTIS